jgi:site-specific recombinase XerC
MQPKTPCQRCAEQRPSIARSDECNGLSASRVRQAHQLVGAVLKFAVKAKHLPASPADGVELPRLPEAEQRYLTHEQLHQVAVAAGRLRTLVLVLGYSAGRPFSDFALTPSSRYSSTMVSPLRSA